MVSESDMWALEWKWILHRAIQRRETSWGGINPALVEFRNAGDTLAGEVIDEMKKKGLIKQNHVKYKGKDRNGK